MDTAGNVACATSTGGIRNKMVGRVGDSPVIGTTSSKSSIYTVSISMQKKKCRSFLVIKAPEDTQTTSAVPCLAPGMGSLFLKSRWPDSFFHMLNKVTPFRTLH